MKQILAFLAGLAVLLAAFATLGAGLRHAFDADPVVAPAVAGDLAVGLLAAGCSIAAAKGFVFWIHLFSREKSDAS